MSEHILDQELENRLDLKNTHTKKKLVFDVAHSGSHRIITYTTTKCSRNIAYRASKEKQTSIGPRTHSVDLRAV